MGTRWECAKYGRELAPVDQIHRRPAMGGKIVNKYSD